MKNLSLIVMVACFFILNTARLTGSQSVQANTPTDVLYTHIEISGVQFQYDPLVFPGVLIMSGGHYRATGSVRTISPCTLQLLYGDGQGHETVLDYRRGKNRIVVRGEGSSIPGGYLIMRIVCHNKSEIVSELNAKGK